MCSRGHQASLITAITQDTLVKTQSLFRTCVLVLSSITSRSVAAAAASSLMRFSPSPSCRGDAANPWLESAFITHFGCVSRHLFVCFPQSIVIACVSLRVSSLLVFLLCFSRVSPLLVFLLCFSRVSSLLVFPRRVSPLHCVSRRVSPLLVFLLLVSAEYRHCLCCFCWFSQTCDDLAVLLIPSVCRSSNFLSTQCTLAAFVVGAGAQRHARLEEEEASLEWRRAQTDKSVGGRCCGHAA